MAAARPPIVPPGNFIARQLKIINDESRGKVIPTTAASQRSYKKYSTMYDVQYSSMNEDLLCQFLKQKEEDAAVRVKIEDARETVGDVFGVKRAKKPEHLKDIDISSEENLQRIPAIQMFSSWKVPNRFSDDVTASTDMAFGAGNKPSTARLPRLEVRRSQSVSGRRANLPETRGNSVSPRRLGTSRRNRDVTTPQVNMSKVLQPHAVNQASDWINRAPMADRKVIQDVLRMAENKHQQGHVAKQGFQPDVQSAVNKWLTGASEKDRAVALEFFNSMAGSKLIGSTSGEQSARLQEVIKALKGDNGGMPQTSASRQGLNDELHPSLKHLRLLSPTSRKNRWMETTWHHLPEYRQTDPVNNWTSVYTRPHGFIPRHFTIHPEWG